MSLSLLKWGVAAIALVLVLLAAAMLVLRKTFHAEMMIPAPPEAVWAVLMDTQAYPQWNPVFVALEGDYAEGKKVVTTVRDPNGAVYAIGSRVKTLRPNEELRQTGGLFGIITFDHRWRLKPAPGGTRIVQHEVDRGIALLFMDLTWIEPAYAAANEALAERVRALAQPQP